MARTKRLKEVSMVLYNVHIYYRVFGGKKVNSAKKLSAIQKALKSTKKNVAALNVIHAVKGVSFTVNKGETVGLIGSNGAGKSTLLKGMAGVLPYEAGSIYSKGTSSLLGVHAALIPSLSGERNIKLGCLALGLSQKEINKKFDQIVEFSGIGDFVYLPMTAYSSGMAARLRFAISVSKVPEILMIDEALATGDKVFQQKSKDRVDEIRKKAGTVFLVSHSNVHILEMCDRTIWLDHGRVIADGPSEEIVAAYEVFADAMSK
jgi:teichoic acid transport system ATP-binding protein